MDKNISDLVHHLKYEKLFIDSERQHIENLNLKLMKIIEKVYQASFIRGEQRRNYNDLVLLPHSSPPACCQRANFLSQLQFIDGYQVLGYLETLFGEVLSGLRENPRLCARCLVVGESISLEMMQNAASTLMASVYGNYILPEDELCLLYLLSNLIELQLASSQNPRRLLMNGSCAFSQVYKTYIESLPQAKVFLTAALHEPIMQLLMEDELFLDIDPANAAGRFPQEERHRRFGKEGTKEYVEALAKYRVWTISKLVKITKRFIESIQQAFHCFPSTLAWLVRSVYETLVNSKDHEERDISILCVDLVFTFFICSAVVAPEPQGIVDAPISHISRFNLIQVAQILQGLAMNKWEQPDTRTVDLYDHFDKKALTKLLDSIINCGIPDQPPTSSVGNFPLLGLSRSGFMIPQSHLMQLIGFLFQVQEKLSEGSTSHKDLSTVLSTIKPHFDQLQQQQQQSNCLSGGLNFLSNHHTSPHGNHSEGSKGGSQTNHCSQESGTAHGSSPSTSTKKNLLNRVRSSRKSKTVSVSHDSSLEGHDDSVSQSSALTPSTSNPSLHSQHSSSLEDREDSSSSLKYETVLVIPLPGNIGRRECPGMMSEDKVLYSLQGSKTVARISKPGVEEGERVVVPSGGVGDGTIEKRTRFSLSHDEGSIGNTSDNLEAISEAASNHSVASSMDDVEQVDPPDNLSDMVSANVSGRGTPNVSGRDTPSSQITEGEEGGLRGAGEPPNRAQNIPVTVAKGASADIEEKFGRFEIKPIPGGGDETISLVSDTWSTDVLASDSEIIDPAERDREHLLDQHLVELDRMHGQAAGRSEFLRSGETFETASEAWSMDVLASDSERLTEFDTDDAQSVARSDDTGRSEVEVDLSVVDGAGGGGGGGQAQVKIDGASEDSLTPRPIMTSKSLDNEPTSEASSERAESEPSMGTLKAMNSDQKRGKRCIPVTKVNDETSPSSRLLCDNSSALTFKPIHLPPKDKDDINGDIENNVLAAKQHVKNETSGIQSLGRLSLNLSDLPCNGMVASGDSLVFNQISSTNKDTVNGFEEPKLSSHVALLNGDLDKELEETSQETLEERKVEEINIHLSTVSLASSGSSESDGILQGAKASLQQQESHHQRQQQQQHQQQQQSKELSPRPHTIEVSPSVNCESDGHGSSSSLSNLASTGAIPKSISFDKTAERGDKDSESDSKHKKGFFKVFKLPAFKGRRKVSGTLSNRSEDYSFNRASLSSGDANIRRSFSEDNRRTILEESTDEILAKYRKKPETSETDSSKQDSNVENPRPLPERLKSEEEERSVDAFSESSFAFKDAKRKLRMVLSSADFFLTSNSIYFSLPDMTLIRDNDEILSWLRTQLAEAQNLQDRSLVAQLHETLRCLQLIDHQGRESVVHSLKDDYQSRSPYIAYLIRSRQGLLSSIDHLEKLLFKLETDTSIVMTSMVNVCVRMFLEKRDESLAQFTRNFMQLTVPDEKVELVESFLRRLYSELERDPMWLSSSSEQLSVAKASLERSIMSHIYIHALYPNGDGDVSRDQVLFEHMKKLSEIITPGHKDLRIPKHYQYECPWPSAQAELTYLSAYKTSSDKVRCVVRTCKTIMNLLSMGHDSSIPAADDFIPVLVYVLIKANPPGLLSTVQYVDLFYEQRIMGEDRYWWTQFCSSIEFIKTMDYTP